MHRLWLCGVLIFPAFVSGLFANDEIMLQKFSTRRILAKILERQKKVASAKFEWTEQCLEAQGFRHDPARDVPAPKNDAQPVTPRADVTYSQDQSFSFDGGKTNYVYTHLAFNKVGIPFHRRSRTTFDGLQQRQMTEPTPDFNLSHGRIYRDDAPRVTLSLLDLEPILLCYRLGDTRIQIAELDGYARDLNSSEIDGVPCVMLASESRGRKLWLDPVRDFFPIRSTHEVNGVLRRQIDYSYMEDPDHGWVLSGWSIRKLDGQGKHGILRTATVVSYQINPTFDDAEFKIEFPKGTLIDDLREQDKVK